jgi:hypothetical protein
MVISVQRGYFQKQSITIWHTVENLTGMVLRHTCRGVIFAVVADVFNG